MTPDKAEERAREIAERITPELVWANVAPKGWLETLRHDITKELLAYGNERADEVLEEVAQDFDRLGGNVSLTPKVCADHVRNYKCAVTAALAIQTGGTLPESPREP